MTPPTCWRRQPQQARLTQTHNRLTDAHTRLAKAHNRLTDELTEAHNRLTEEIAGYVAGCRERMQQMEANLHALIHILTAEQ